MNSIAYHLGVFCFILIAKITLNVMYQTIIITLPAINKRFLNNNNNTLFDNMSKTRQRIINFITEHNTYCSACGRLQQVLEQIVLCISRHNVSMLFRDTTRCIVHKNQYRSLHFWHSLHYNHNGLLLSGLRLCLYVKTHPSNSCSLISSSVATQRNSLSFVQIKVNDIFRETLL